MLFFVKLRFFVGTWLLSFQILKINSPYLFFSNNRFFLFNEIELRWRDILFSLTHFVQISVYNTYKHFFTVFLLVPALKTYQKWIKNVTKAYKKRKNPSSVIFSQYFLNSCLLYTFRRNVYSVSIDSYWWSLFFSDVQINCILSFFSFLIGFYP